MAKVLIAEHNKTVSTYLASHLRKSGNVTLTVDNHLDAWRAAVNESFDVLMVDVVMPGIDGFILAQRLLQENPELQVIFITGFSGIAMDTYATPAFAPAPVTMRPFHLRETASRIRYLLGLGGLPASALMGHDDHAEEGNVVYADFSAKQAAAHQAAT